MSLTIVAPTHEIQSRMSAHLTLVLLLFCSTPSVNSHFVTSQHPSHISKVPWRLGSKGFGEVLSMDLRNPKSLVLRRTGVFGQQIRPAGKLADGQFVDVLSGQQQDGGQNTRDLPMRAYAEQLSRSRNENPGHNRQFMNRPVQVTRRPLYGNEPTRPRTQQSRVSQRLIDFIVQPGQNIELTSERGQGIELRANPRQRIEVAARPRSGQIIELTPRSGQAIKLDPRSGVAMELAPSSGRASETAPRFRQAFELPTTSRMAMQLAPRSAQAIELGPRSGQAIERPPRFGQAIELAPRSKQAIRLGPRAGQAIQSAPRSGQTIELAPRSGQANERPIQLAPGQGIEFEAKPGQKIEFQIQPGRRIQVVRNGQNFELRMAESRTNFRPQNFVPERHSGQGVDRGAQFGVNEAWNFL